MMGTGRSGEACRCQCSSGYSTWAECRRLYVMLQVLKLDGKMLELAEQLKGEQSLLVFGRGYNYATALEAALKVGLVASAMVLVDLCRQSVCSASWIKSASMIFFCSLSAARKQK